MSIPLGRCYISDEWAEKKDGRTNIHARKKSDSTLVTRSSAYDSAETLPYAVHTRKNPSQRQKLPPSAVNTITLSFHC